MKALLIDGSVKESVLGAAELILTEEQITLIRNEIANDPMGLGYAGKTAKEQATLLCRQYFKPNPTPQPVVSNGYVTGLRVMMMGVNIEYLGVEMPLKMKFELMAESTDLNDKIKGKSVLEVCNWEAINTADPRIIEKFEAFVADDLLPRDFVSYVLYKLDPDWPEMVLNPVSRLYELIGVDGVILGSELE